MDLTEAPPRYTQKPLKAKSKTEICYRSSKDDLLQGLTRQTLFRKTCVVRFRMSR